MMAEQDLTRPFSVAVSALPQGGKVEGGGGGGGVVGLTTGI